MKNAIALALAASALAAFGCTTTMSPEKKYQSDAPPKLEKASANPTDTTPSRISSNTRPPAPDDINSDNYLDAARRLDNTMRDEGRAMSKAGK
jgi:hypothetical protein